MVTSIFSPHKITGMKKLSLLPLLVLFSSNASTVIFPSIIRNVKEVNIVKAINAPNVSLLDIHPVDPSGGVVYLSCASPTSKKNETALLSVTLSIKNNESNDLRWQKVTIQCSGGFQNVSRTYESPDRGGTVVKSKDTLTWQNKRKYHEMGDVIMLIPPYPTGITIKVYFQNFSDPFIVSKTLSKYQNVTSRNGYGFPGKDEDLLMNEYWYADAAHGGGDQVFAYDIIVVGWDEKEKKWSDMKQGKTTDSNQNYRVYGKKIYAIADGEVISYINGWGETPSNSDSGTRGGNGFKINNGKESISYWHMQPGSLNSKLTKIGAIVKKGDFLGLAGNSGNSSGPHVHIQAFWDPDKDGQGSYLPLHFSNIYSIDIRSVPEPDPGADWVKLNNKGLPYIDEKSGRPFNDRALIWPDEKKPCWYPYNLGEVARNGISEGKYQEEFNKISGCGYYPVWVDAYDVAGKTFFNTIFRYNKNNYAVTVRHNMTKEEYQGEYNEWVKQKDYRLQQIDNYNDGGKLKIAAIFIKKSGQPQSQPAYHALSAGDHQNLFEQYTKDGYVPVNVSVTSVGGKLYYSAFYEKRNVGAPLLKSQLTQEEYQETFDDMKKKNFEQVYVNAYHHEGKTRFSAIWYEKSGYQSFTAVRRAGMDAYTGIWADNLANGFLTRCVTGYDEGGKHWFAAHWSK
jgi:hypothetical protein